MSDEPTPTTSTLSRSDRLSLLVQTLTALAVVFSVIYLAVQVRQNAAATRTNTGLGLYQYVQTQSSWIVTNPDFADVVGRGSMSRDSLARFEQAQYQAFQTSVINLWEFGHSSDRAGTVDSDLWASFDASLRPIHCQESYVAHWDGSRDGYEVRFRTYIDGLIEQREELCQEDAETDTATAEPTNE